MLQILGIDTNLVRSSAALGENRAHRSLFPTRLRNSEVARKVVADHMVEMTGGLVSLSHTSDKPAHVKKHDYSMKELINFAEKERFFRQILRRRQHIYFKKSEQHVGSRTKHIRLQTPLLPSTFKRYCPLLSFGTVVQKRKIDRIFIRWYVGSMKTKTSITLSNEVLKAIDLYIGDYRSRSEFIETATRKFIAQLARKEAERSDLELINGYTDALNAEAEDVLTYQVPL
jgi:Arc/MetJ-type ribon-helix-helix transcriptional regulator